jgi:hypothetical protein
LRKTLANPFSLSQTEKSGLKEDMNYIRLTRHPNPVDFVKLPIRIKEGHELANLKGLLKSGQNIDLEQRSLAEVKDFEAVFTEHGHAIMFVADPEGKTAHAHFYLQKLPNKDIKLEVVADPDPARTKREPVGRAVFTPPPAGDCNVECPACSFHLHGNVSREYVLSTRFTCPRCGAVFEPRTAGSA